MPDQHVMTIPGKSNPGADTSRGKVLVSDIPLLPSLFSNLDSR